MKVLFVSPFFDGTGYARAGIDYALALDAAGVEVVPRALKLNGHRPAPGEVPARLLELERRSPANPDVIVQHALPHHMEPSHVPTVGLFAWETTHFRTSNWADRLNRLDAVWVVSRDQEAACRASGVRAPIRVAPHACDVRRYQGAGRPPEELKPHLDRGEFLFYAVGEWVRRKNFAGLLRAFHAEFDRMEPVRLVVKTSGDAGEVRKFCENVRQGVKREARGELVLTRRLGEGELMGLHANCHCFALLSHGEAWSIPAFDAMAMGRTPVHTHWGGPRDWLTEAEGFPVPYRPDPCFGATDSYRDLYVGDEEWAAPCLSSARRALREAYGCDQEVRRRNGILKAYDFSHEAVGALLKGFLHDALARGAGQ